MRLLNEKTLLKLCQRRRATREGYLRMRRVNSAGSASSEKRQYFRLCGNLLYYLDRPQDDQPVGVIILAGHMVEPAEEHDQAATFCVAFQDACTYQLTASSAEEAALWMHAVIGAAHECAQSMADSLQEQLSAITLADGPLPVPAIKAAHLSCGVESTSAAAAAAASAIPASSAAATAAEFSAALDRRLEAVYQLMLACSDRQSS